MKIDRQTNNIINLEQAYSGERIRKSERRADQTQRGERINAAGDRVNISSQGATIQRIKAKIAAIPDIRQDLVNKAKQDLVSGNYQVDNDKVARAMIRESLMDYLL